MAALHQTSSSSHRGFGGGGGGHQLQSPFKESDWDRKLDGLLQDLETTTSNQQQFGGRHQHHHHQATSSISQSYSSSSTSRQQQQGSVRFGTASEVSNGYSGVHGGGISKSASSHSIQDSADTMLKDLEGSLKASSNYIESHRTVQGPTGTQEYHEYRSYSSCGCLLLGVGEGGFPVGWLLADICW